MMKKTWSAAMAALMVGSLLSGCSGSKTAAPSTAAASSEAATEAETTIEAFTEEEYAIAVAKDNDDLLKKMNEALASLKESGKIDEIVAKYISADKAE